MKETIFEFNPEKNQQLKNRYGIGFDEIIALINEGSVIDIADHPNPARYPNQLVYVLDVDEYVYLVPFVRNGEKRFLKTFYPSRKATKSYGKEKPHAP